MKKIMIMILVMHIALLSLIMIGGINMSKRTYCAEDKCEFETYEKEELDEKLGDKQQVILSGTEEPSNDLGEDGDIYIKYS